MADIPYTDYSHYISRFFPGIKIQKISVNAGFSCPNRDGTIGTGGCIYCDNSSFTPGYCLDGGSITRQIEEGKRFFARKYPEMKYLAYFQSFTSTHSESLSLLERNFREAANVPDVVGIIVGTRPDSLNDGVLSILKELTKETKVFLELGAESSFDKTLRLINRGHEWKDTVDAVVKASAAGIPTGLHLIAGLPGETDEMVLETVRKACALPIDSLKLHQLQVISGTRLHSEWEKGAIEVIPYTLERYLDLCVRIVKEVPKHIAIERFLASSPPEKVVAPKWGLKNYQFTNLLHNLLK